MVNAYLLKATDGFVLVDTGLPNNWDALNEQLAAAGCLPDRLKLVVITHGDLDHTGGCLNLREKYGAKIAIHHDDAEMVEKGVVLKREITNPIFKMMMKLRKHRMRGRMPQVATFEPDIILSDGQSLEEYGVDAKVLHLPGHTPGSIAILMSDGDIIVGDTLSNMFKPGVSPFIADRDQLARSVKALKEMDLKTIYPGHGKAFSAGALSKISVK